MCMWVDVGKVGMTRQCLKAAHDNHSDANLASLSGWTGGHESSMTVSTVIPLFLQCKPTRPRQEGLRTWQDRGGEAGKADSCSCHCMMAALARFNRADRQPAIPVLKLIVERYDYYSIDAVSGQLQIRGLLEWRVTAALPSWPSQKC